MARHRKKAVEVNTKNIDQEVGTMGLVDSALAQAKTDLRSPKKWYTSSTIQGAIVILILAAVKLLGISIIELEQMFDDLINIGQAAAGMWVIFARLLARQTLE